MRIREGGFAAGTGGFLPGSFLSVLMEVSDGVFFLPAGVHPQAASTTRPRQSAMEIPARTINDFFLSQMLTMLFSNVIVYTATSNNKLLN